MNANNSVFRTIVKVIALLLVAIILSEKEGQAQFTQDFVSQSGTGDLTISLGRYQIGNAIRIEAQINGSWAGDGGIYHIVGDWDQKAKVVYRGESSISQRLRFYGYVDPSHAGHIFLFVTWDNVSPNESHSNGVKFRITSAGNFDVNNAGIFSNASELSNVFTIQSTTENVGIGTINPIHKLTVAGTGKFQEIIVEEDAGADYVFEEDYKLPSLTEIEAYIKANKHLPEIASAEHMKKEGVKVGELQIQLLKKIEELTLYGIEQMKTNQYQKQKIEDQDELIRGLIQRIEKLEAEDK